MLVKITQSHWPEALLVFHIRLLIVNNDLQLLNNNCHFNFMKIKTFEVELLLKTLF